MSSYFSFPNDINLLEKIQGHPNDSRDLEIFSPPEKNDSYPFSDPVFCWPEQKQIQLLTVFLPLRPRPRS